LAREAGKLGDLSILRTNRDVLEPYWQDEMGWLCTVEFLPTDNPEARLFAADIIRYGRPAFSGVYAAELFRALRLVPDASTANGIDTSTAVPSPVD
jgi:hypothetical protein